MKSSIYQHKGSQEEEEDIPRTSPLKKTLINSLFRGTAGEMTGTGGGGGECQVPPTTTKLNPQQEQQQKAPKQGGASPDSNHLDAPPGDPVPCLTCGSASATISIYTRVGNAEAVLSLLALILRQPVGSVALPSNAVCAECLEQFKLMQKLMARLAQLARKTALGYRKVTKGLGKKADDDACLLVVDGVGGEAREGGIISRALAMGSAAKTVPKSAVERRFECQVCGKRFRAYSHRVEHMLVHTGERAFKCTECGFEASTKSNLTRHKQQHRREFSCQLCGKTLGNKSSLKEHLQTHGKDRPHKCQRCGKGFLRRRELRVHERGHGDDGTRSHECSVCGKAFVLRSRLQRHLLTHKDEKEFVCETCDKRFARKDDLTCHRRTHTGEKPYSCEKCGRAFRYISNCRSHMKVHLRTSLTCTTCNMSFPTEGKYETHLKSRRHRRRCNEEDEEPAVDESGVCEVAFSSLEQLSTHTLPSHITPTILPAPPDTSIIISGGVGGGVEGGEAMGVMAIDGVSVVVAVGGPESSPLPLSLPHPSPPSSALLVGGDGPPPPSPTFPFTIDAKVGEGEAIEGTILNFTESEVGRRGPRDDGARVPRSVIAVPFTSSSSSSSSSTSTTAASAPPQKVTVFRLSEWDPNGYYDK